MERRTVGTGIHSLASFLGQSTKELGQASEAVDVVSRDIFHGCTIRGRIVELLRNQRGTLSYLVAIQEVIDWVAGRLASSKVKNLRAHLRGVCLDTVSATAPGTIGVVGSLVYAVVQEIDEVNERVLLTFDDAFLLWPEPGIKLGVCLESEYIPGDSLAPRSVYSEHLSTSVAKLKGDDIEFLKKRWGIEEYSSALVARHTPKYPRNLLYKSLRKEQDVVLGNEKVKSGVDHQRAGRKSEALFCYEQALKVDPSNVDAYVARGALYATNSNYEEAIKDLLRAIELNPEHRNAKKYLQTSYIRRGKLFEVKENYQHALEDYRKAAKYGGEKFELAQDGLRRVQQTLDNREREQRSKEAAAMAAFGFGSVPPSASASVTPTKKSTSLLSNLEELMRLNKHSSKKKKKKSKKRHKRSRDSESSGDDDSSDGYRDSSRKHHKNKKKKREK